MRKLTIRVLTFLFLSTVFFSCEKCQTCLVKEYSYELSQDNNGQVNETPTNTPNTTTSISICEDQLDQIQNEPSQITITESNGKQYVNIKNYTNCK